jgi:hypothetical protein
MARLEMEKRKDGWHYLDVDGVLGKDGGPFKTREEAEAKGYDLVLKAEAKATKDDPNAALGFVPQEELTGEAAPAEAPAGSE